MQKKFKQAYGNWVEGDRFWDREGDTELLIKKLDAGAHILLVASINMFKLTFSIASKKRGQDACFLLTNVNHIRECGT